MAKRTKYQSDQPTGAPTGAAVKPSVSVEEHGEGRVPDGITKIVAEANAEATMRKIFGKKAEDPQDPQVPSAPSPQPEAPKDPPGWPGGFRPGLFSPEVPVSLRARKGALGMFLDSLDKWAKANGVVAGIRLDDIGGSLFCGVPGRPEVKPRTIWMCSNDQDWPSFFRSDAAKRVQEQAQAVKAAQP